MIGIDRPDRPNDEGIDVFMVATARATSKVDDAKNEDVTSGAKRTKRRRRLLGAAAIATLAIVASACLPPAPPPSVRAGRPSSPRSTSTAPGLAVNDALTNLAADWARHLAITGVMEHRNLGAVGGWAHLGETIVQGSCGISDAAVVNMWINSPPHYSSDGLRRLFERRRRTSVCGRRT